MRKSVSLLGMIIAISMFICQSSLATETEETIAVYKIVYTDGYEPQEGIKSAYLTFDDGPTQYTPKVLEILAEFDVPATFFVVGNTEYTHYMSDIVENGHAIGLHSYNHNFEQIYQSTEAFFADLKKIDDIVYDETGIRSNIMRFPGGSSVSRGDQAVIDQLKNQVVERGYQYFDWNCDSADKMGVKTAAGAISRIESMEQIAGDIAIVLMHDTEKITVEYLPRVISYFKGLGYDFKHLRFTSPAVQHTW